jgi:peptidoglycan/xylan/chitin deacetylase (PgdA/CDA1 family)
MSRRVRLVLAVLACLLAAAPAAAGGMLDALWSARELEGSADDPRVGPVTAPDTSPPARRTPAVRLAPVPEADRNVIRRVRLPEGEKAVALTFDLCERATNRAGYQNAIVNALRREDVRATFFAGGKWMRSHPEKTLQLLADPRFELGNHAWTHGNLGIMRGSVMLEQILWTQAQYEILRAELARRAEAKGLAAAMERVPAAMRLFRLPYGRSSPEALSTLAGLGLFVIQWDVEGERNELALSPRAIAENAARAVRPGSIVLLHANGVPQKTQLVVPLLIAKLKAAGFRFVTVSELLALGRAETVAEGYFSRPGDNLQYDTLFQGQGAMRRRPDR